MRPPPHSFTPRLSSFICRSCLARSRAPELIHLRKLSRNATPTKQRTVAEKKSDKRTVRNPTIVPAEPVIRYFDETPDGDRREIVDSPDEVAFLTTLKSTILQLEKEVGDYKPSGNDSNNDVLLDLNEDGLWQPPDTKGEGYLAENLDLEIDDTQGLVNRLKVMLQKDSLSTEDILNIRDDVFRSDLTERELPPDSKDLRTATIKNLEFGSPDKRPLHFSYAIPAEEYPKEYSHSISLLNDSLRRASQGLIDLSSFKSSGLSGSKYSKDGHLTRDVHRRLWKCYVTIRKVLLSKPACVSPRAWSVLWDAVSEQSATNVNRITHLRQLGSDMRIAGLELHDAQLLKYIESCLVQGDYTAALEQWEIGLTSLGSSRESSREFWTLGVQLRSKLDQVDLALAAAEKVFESSDDVADARILLHIIQACLASTGERTSLAFSLYIQLRSKLGPTITMNDYDAVTMLLLNANKSNLALVVFTDMMLSAGTSDVSPSPKTADPNGQLSLSILHLCNEGLDWENSKALAALPSQFNNKYFFGSWIKKLIGRKQLDGARRVLDLMRERGICPDARHVNGLIGAWFRENSAESQRLAEDMAWSMIRSRLDFVKVRDTKFLFEPPLNAVKREGKPDHKSLSLTPKATIETFSILISYYRRSRNQSLLMDLFETIGKARIRPDTFIMNQLIMVDAHSEQMSWAWDTYRDLVHENGVAPDFDTYAILWAFMKNSVNPALRRTPLNDFPTPRDLFAEMVRCRVLLQTKDSAPQPLYELIIQCFGMSNDLAGTAVALKALHGKFNLFPTKDTIHHVVLQLAHVGHRSEVTIRRHRQDSQINSNKVAEVAKVLQHMKSKSVEKLLQQGVVFENLTDVEKLEDNLNILCRLLGYVVQTRLGAEGGGIVTKLSERAAEDMGVADCACWTEIA